MNWRKHLSKDERSQLSVSEALIVRLKRSLSAEAKFARKIRQRAKIRAARAKGRKG